MKWQIKVLKLAFIGRIPFGNGLRKLKRRFLGYKADIPNIHLTIRNLEQMEVALRSIGRSFKSATVLEIGTGWFPVIPIAMAVRGAKHVTMTDLTPHMDSSTLRTAGALFEKYGYSSAELEKTYINVSDLPLTYLAPFDASQVADESIDIVTSRTVLEHIPPEEIIKLLLALKKKLASNGIMIHLVDHSDHLEHADKSITKINFLTWSNRKHTIVNRMTKEGENRLRHQEYKSIFERAGYKLLQEISEVHEPTLSIAKQLPLVDRFADMRAEDLATLCSIYILAPLQGNQDLLQEPVVGRTPELD